MRRTITLYVIFITVLLGYRVTNHPSLPRTERVPGMQNFSFKIRIVSDEPERSGNTIKPQFHLSPKSRIMKLRLQEIKKLAQDHKLFDGRT